MAYDVKVLGILQVKVRYRKVIVSNSADDGILTCMKGVGVGVVAEDAGDHHALLLRSDDLMENILPGMDFLDLCDASCFRDRLRDTRQEGLHFFVI